jgi:type IV pilus assembly protein PilV
MLTLTPHARQQTGFTLLEILIAIVLLAFGLLGIASLQVKIQGAGMESFQRSQAILMLQDMVGRINANRANATAYLATNVGTGETRTNCTGSLAAQDLCEWSQALKGAAEELSDGTQVGGMIGALGCIEQINAGPPQTLRVTVAWQGLSATSAPSLTCGQGEYGDDDKFRRVISSLVTIAKLD